MMSDELLLFSSFGIASFFSFVGPYLLAALRQRRALTAEEKSVLLEELDAARICVSSLLPHANTLVKAHNVRRKKARSAQEAAPLEHSVLCGAIERRLEQERAAVPRVCTERELEELLLGAGGDASVRAAVLEVRRAHPLYAPAELLLEVQRDIFQEQGVLYATLVGKASAAGMSTASADFEKLAMQAFEEVLGGKGDPAALSLAPAVLARRSHAELAGKEGLWEQLLSAGLVAEGEGTDTQFTGFQGKLQRIFKSYEKTMTEMGLGV